MFGFGEDKKVHKVLIVEDDSLLAKVLSDNFVEEGFEVAIVDNGLKVEDTVKSFKPHIILLDLVIPGMDGFAILKGLKAGAKSKDIPVAVISNLGEAGDVKSAKALGAEEYFIKSNTEMGKIVKYVKKKLRA